jgi:hypothetical protein
MVPPFFIWGQADAINHRGWPFLAHRSRGKKWLRRPRFEATATPATGATVVMSVK